MQQQVDFEVAPRETRGKNAARRLRAAGKVPAVVYGLGRDAQAVEVDAKEMTGLLQDPAGHNRVLNLKGSGGEESVMAVDYQVDPVRNHLLHVDLRRINLDKSVTVEVPIATVGVAFGVKNEGGFEEMVNRQVSIECLPLEIPEKIEIDVTDLQLGHSVRVKDLPTSDAYKLVDDEGKLLLHIMAPKTVEEEAEEAEEPVEGEEAPTAEGAEKEAEGGE